MKSQRIRYRVVFIPAGQKGQSIDDARDVVQAASRAVWASKAHARDVQVMREDANGTWRIVGNVRRLAGTMFEPEVHLYDDQRTEQQRTEDLGQHLADRDRDQDGGVLAGVFGIRSGMRVPRPLRRNT